MNRSKYQSLLARSLKASDKSLKTIFKQENNLKHTSKSTEERLHQILTNFKSSDLNFIENQWADLK